MEMEMEMEMENITPAQGLHLTFTEIFGSVLDAMQALRRLEDGPLVAAAAILLGGSLTGNVLDLTSPLSEDAEAFLDGIVPNQPAPIDKEKLSALLVSLIQRVLTPEGRKIMQSQEFREIVVKDMQTAEDYARNARGDDFPFMTFAL